MQESQYRPPEQPLAGGPQPYCPECGEPMGPEGAYPQHHKGHYRWHMGPWGRMRHAGPCGPGAMMWVGIVPALLGFALGYTVATARMSAWYGMSEGKRKHWRTL